MYINGLSSISFKGNMFTTDLDGTLLIADKDNLKRNVEDRQYDTEAAYRAFASLKRNNFDSIMINTGRNFTELSEIKDFLQQSDAPIDAISLEDGKRLLKKPVEMTSEQWLAQLFGGKVNYLAFADKGWSEKTKAPLDKIGEYLTEKEGFLHRKDDNENLIYMKDVQKDDAGVKTLSSNAKWKVTIVPPGITFKVSLIGSNSNDKINLKEFNDDLAAKIYNILEQNGFDISAANTEKEVSYVNNFARKDVNKGTVADYVKETKDEDTKEVRAGNDYNDVEMLQNTDIPAIVVGDNKILSQTVQDRDNLTKVSDGELDKGIDIVGAKLDTNI